MALYEFLVHTPIPPLQTHSIYFYKHAYQQNIHKVSSHSTLEISTHTPSQNMYVIQLTENQAVKLLKTILLNTPTCMINLTSSST